jgi:hypothetical protein
MQQSATSSELNIFVNITKVNMRLILQSDYTVFHYCTPTSVFSYMQIKPYCKLHHADAKNMKLFTLTPGLIVLSWKKVREF